MMKNILYAILISLSFVPMAIYAQPVNDACANAIPMVLATPAACASGSTSGFHQGATTTLTGQTNVGATSSAPYPYLAACAINYFSTPLDVWYSFVATGFQTTITVSNGTGTLTNPTITMWEGACNGLIGQGCSSGTAGAATLTVYQTVIGQTYYVQVAGADSTQHGTFTIGAACANNCAGCLQQSFITAGPEPVNGGYSPGQTVEFCYTVTAFDEGNANWLHGVSVSFGNGWDTSTIVIVSVPPSCTVTTGAYWAYYPQGQTSSATGTYFGPGFYYETSAGATCTCINSNPGDNFGDDNAAQGTCNPTFCLQITTKLTDTAGSNLNVTFRTSGDGESGSWTSSGCVPDPAISAYAVSACAAPHMAHINASCHLPNGVDTAYAPPGNHGPYIYHWSTGYVDTTNSFSVITGLAPGTYTVTVVNALDCIVTNSDSIKDSTFAYGGPTKYVSCPIQTDSTILTAVGTGVWTALGTNPAATTITAPNNAVTGVSGFTAFGIYKYVWTVGCAADTVSVIVTSHPNSGPDEYTCVNGIAVMNAIGIGTWTPVAGNPAPTVIADPTSPTTVISGFTVGGTYNYEWSVGICHDTASVIIPNFTSVATIGQSVVCRNQTTTLNVSASPAALGPFTYTWLDASDVVSPHSPSTSTVPILNPTTYIVQISSATGCILYDTLHVTLSGAAPVVNITASNDNVCPGDTVTLSSQVFAENLVTCGLVDTCVNNNLLFSVAVSNDTSSTTGSPYGYTAVEGSPFRGEYNSYKIQYLFRKSELNAAGLSSGSITDISFFVKQINSTAPYDTFAISMGCTNLDSLTDFVSNVQEVVPPQYGPNAVYPNLGYTPFPFTHFYNWDGVSNIVIQVCYTIDPSINSNDDYVSYNTTPYNGSSVEAGYYSFFGSSGNGCALTQSNADFFNVNNTRANIKFGMCAPNVLTYQWSPHTLFGDTFATAQVIVTKDTTYTLLVNDQGCAGTDSIRVHINPNLGIAVTPADTTLCGRDTVQLHLFQTNPPISQCVQGYSVDTTAYNVIAGTTTAVPPADYIDDNGFTYSTDDGTAGPYPIGFTFPFYCNTYTQFYVNSNGWLTFDYPYPATTNTQEYTAQTFPPSSADMNPMKMIVLMWGNYYLADGFGDGGGNIKYFVTGTAPNRILVVQYNNMKDVTLSYTTSGEMHLHETTGEIDIQIKSSTYSGTAHTTGVKDSTGLGTAAPGENNQNYTVTNTAAGHKSWKFLPEFGPSVGTGGIMWAANPSLSNINIVNPLAYPTSSQTYYVADTLILNQFTNPSTCVVRDSVRVNVNPIAGYITASPDTLCPGTPSQLTFHDTLGTAVSYLWSPALGLSSTTIASPVATADTTTTYHLVATNSGGCKANDSVSIYTVIVPQPQLSPDSTVCYSDSVLLTLSGPYNFYQWYSIDTFTGAKTLVSSGATDNSFYAHPQNNYILQVTPTSGLCAYFTNVVSIDSFLRVPLMVIDTFGPNTVCQGGNVVLETQQGYSNIQWTPNSFGSATSINVAASGSYSYTARDANNCMEYSNAVVVTVNPIPVFTLNAVKNPICSTDIDTLIAGTVPAGATITWTYNGVPQAPGNTLIVSVAGTDSLYAELNGCSNDTVITINGAISPIVTVPVMSVECNCTPVLTPLPVGAAINGGVPPYTYIWSNGGSGSSTLDSIAGTTAYYVTVTDANGCTAMSNADSVTLSCPGATISVMPVSDTIYLSDTAILTATPNVAGASYGYLWTGSSTTTIITPSGTVTGVIGDSTGIDTVYLLVTDKNSGCPATIAFAIHVIDFGAFTMADAFSPNGDGKNDFFYPVTNGPNSPVKVKAFRIYDRWGQLVYDNPNAPGWDGNFGGTPQTIGTYLYFTTIDYPDPNDASRTIQRSVEGSFQLLR
jgi:gliding motility-associated-like protein